MNEALTDVTSALDLDPEDTHALRTRVDLYAGLGRWTKALADVSRLAELKLDPFTRYQQAVILLMLGQVESYREICHKGFVGNPDQLIYEAQLQAWTCALTPDAVADFKPLLPLVRKSIGLDPDAMPGSLGVLLFRAGQAKEAVDVLIEANRFWEQSGSIVSPGSYSDSLPGYTWYFLAMACHDLGRFAESKTWYDKAESYTQTTHSQTAVFAQSGSINWHQRVVLEMLQREARKVLGVSTP